MTRCRRTDRHTCTLGAHLPRTQPERDWVPLFSLTVVVLLVLLGGFDGWRS